jgi:hypothetical protein
MVRVEAPPTIVTPPPARDRTAPWLVLGVVVLLVDAFLPWERWCGTGAFDDELRRCFSARLWSGSASILGGLALVLLVAYVVATVRTGVRTPVGGVRLAGLACALAALVAKLLIGSQNDQTTSEAQSLVGSAWVGMGIGAFLTVAGISLLAATLWKSSPRLRSIAVHAVLVLTIFVGATLYAGSGLAWWGGPLVEPGFLGGGNGAGYTRAARRPILFDGLLYVRNLGHVGATLDGLDLVSPLGRIRVRGSYVIHGEHCTKDAITLPVRSPNGCVYPLDGYRIEPGSKSDSVMLAMLLDVPHPGVYRSGWFRIRYHVGPIRFEIFRTDQLVVCAPQPGKTHCPGDGM